MIPDASAPRAALSLSLRRAATTRGGVDRTPCHFLDTRGRRARVLASLRKQRVSTSITKSLPIGVSGGERNSIIAIKARPDMPRMFGLASVTPSIEEELPMTDLPIDYRKRPWPTKHLTDETPVLNLWTIFGARDDGSVDISDGLRDIFQWVPRGVAEDIVRARNAFVVVVVKHLGLGSPDLDPRTW